MTGPDRTLLRPPTLKDVAEAAQVSVATVSHVLNPDSDKFVSPALRERILSAAEALDYRPNLLARGMRGKGRRALALLIPQFENFFFTRVVVGAERVAYGHGDVLLICSTYDDPDRERFYIERLISQQVDGFLLSPTLAGTANTRALRERGIPYVVVDRKLRGCRVPYDYVGFSNKAGARLATEHLIARGHRSIGFIGWKTNLPVIGERLDGFREALARHGLDSGACPALLGGHTREAGEKLTAELLRHNEVTAVLVGHQYQGEGAILALRRLGRRIPDDLSLIVYARPTWTELVDPPLVCVDMPDEELGAKAVEVLLERIAGKAGEPREWWLEPSLSPGASVGDGPHLNGGAVAGTGSAEGRKNTA